MNDMLQVILDTTARIFTDHCEVEILDAAEGDEWPQLLWEEIINAGLPLAMVPEALGGSGLSWVDGFAVIRLAGYHAVPVPLAETMLVNRLLAEAGLPLPEGPLSLAPWSPGPQLHAERLEDGWRLSGLCKRVPWGGQVKGVLARANAGNEERLVFFDPSLAEVLPGTNLAFEPRDTLRLDSIVVPASAVLEPGSCLDLFALGALMRIQQMAGGVQRALDQSTEYAGERTQFGRPIGKFQAVQQQLAVMAGHVAATQAAAEAAADNCLSDKKEFYLATAKARAGEAAGEVSAIAHQVHGAMGFTREHSLNYVTRRLWSWRDEFGNESYWQRRLGQQVLSLGADRLWSYLVQPPNLSQGERQ